MKYFRGVFEISIQKFPILDALIFFKRVSLSSGRSGWAGADSASYLNPYEGFFFVTGMNQVVENPLVDHECFSIVLAPLIEGRASPSSLWVFKVPGEWVVTRLKESNCPVRDPKCD